MGRRLCEVAQDAGGAVAPGAAGLRREGGAVFPRTAWDGTVSS